METRNEPVAVTPQPRGILERLKSQNSLEGIVELCRELETFQQVSGKTTRRFGRILAGILKVQDDETRETWKSELLAHGFGGPQ